MDQVDRLVISEKAVVLCRVMLGDWGAVVGLAMSFECRSLDCLSLESLSSNCLGFGGSLVLGRDQNLSRLRSFTASSSTAVDDRVTGTGSADAASCCPCRCSSFSCNRSFSSFSSARRYRSFSTLMALRRVRTAVWMVEEKSVKESSCSASASWCSKVPWTSMIRSFKAIAASASN